MCNNRLMHRSDQRLYLISLSARAQGWLHWLGREVPGQLLDSISTFRITCNAYFEGQRIGFGG